MEGRPDRVLELAGNGDGDPFGIDQQQSFARRDPPPDHVDPHPSEVGQRLGLQPEVPLEAPDHSSVGDGQHLLVAMGQRESSA